MNGFLSSGAFVLPIFGVALLLYCFLSFLGAMLQKFYNFCCRKQLEHDYMKLLRAGRDVEVMIHDHEKILGIPIVECLHRKSMRRNVQYYPYDEKIIFVNPVLKLVDGKVVLVGGVVRKKNKPKRRISAEHYLHYYDPPKLPLYRYDRRQGKFIPVEKKSDQKQA